MHRILPSQKYLVRLPVLLLFVFMIWIAQAWNIQEPLAGRAQAPTPTPVQAPDQERVNNQNTLVDFEKYITRLRDRIVTGQPQVTEQPGGTSPSSPLLTNPEVYQLYMAFRNSDQLPDAIMVETQEKLQGATDTAIKEIVKQLADLLGTPSATP